jgi:hypothetical protein
VLCLQVCCQPSFAAVEAGLQSIQYYSGSPQRGSPAACTEGRAGNSRRVWFAILASRCAYVAVTTLIAAALPFFAVILGLVASLTLYQTAVLWGEGEMELPLHMLPLCCHSLTTGYFHHIAYVGV